MNQNLNETNLEQLCATYGQIIHKDGEEVQSFLRDVRDLNGKLPDAIIARSISNEENEILSGFTEEKQVIYLKELKEALRERISDHEENHDPYFGEGRIRYSTPILGDSELPALRHLAIGRTLKRLIPDYEMMNQSYGFTLNLINTPMGCGVNSKKSRGSRR